MSLSWRLGRAVVLARSRGTLSTVHEDIIQEIGGSQAASKVFEGKIVGIEQSIYKGHSHGTLIIEKLTDYEKETINDSDTSGPDKVRIPFINENLFIEATYTSGEKKVSSSA
jgi:DUF917 family protein